MGTSNDDRGGPRDAGADPGGCVALQQTTESEFSSANLLPLADAADYLGLSQAAVGRAADRGDLSGVPLGGVLSFPIDELDAFLGRQRATALLTGKLTMPMDASVDIPALLSAMVAMPDEARAAASLASEARLLAGRHCRAVAVLRYDDVLQAVRPLALSDFPGRVELSRDDDEPQQTDVTDLPEALQDALTCGRTCECREIDTMLRPIWRRDADKLGGLLDLRSAIVCPLLRIGHVRYALVLLLDSAPESLTREQCDAVEALGIQASVALEAVRLRGDVLNRANRAEALYSTVRMLARSDDSGSMLERIASLAARLLNADAALVLICEGDADDLHVGAQAGIDETSLSWTAHLSSEYLLGRAAGMTRPLQVTDASRTSTLALPRLAGNRRALSALCAPIVHQGSLLGAIEIYGDRPRSFSDDDLSLLSAFAHQAAIALNGVRSQEVRRRALFGAVAALASANEARDGYTGAHCKHLGQLAVLVARNLGFSEDEVERIGLAAALHDIGKIAVPDAILRKPGPLTVEERDVVNQHPATGEEIVGRVPELQDVAEMVGAHQERYDGKGYPRGLEGEDIPIGARIIAVVDTYAALVEDRPYRKGATHAEAVKELVNCAGTQLDPAVVRAFVSLGDSIQQLIAESDLPITDDISWSDGFGLRSTKGRGQPAIEPGGRSRWRMHRASELSVLNEITRVIATTRDPRQMYDKLHRKLAELVDVDAMAILLMPRGTSGRRVAAPQRASIFPVVGQLAEEGIVERVTRLRRSEWVSDYLVFASEHRLVAEPDHPRSIIAVPIVEDDDLLGILTVQALHPNAYDSRHVNLLEDIALHLGVALRRGDALPTPAREDETGYLLKQLPLRLAERAMPSEIAELLAEELRVLLPYDGCLVYLMAHGGLTLGVASGYYSEAERRAYAAYQMPIGMGFIWDAIERGHPYTVDDLSVDSRVVSLIRPSVPGESGLVVPMMHNGEAFGAFFLTRSSVPFGEQDAAVARSIGTLAGRSLAEARERQREQQRVEDLAKLQAAVARVATGVNSKASMAEVVSTLADVFGYRLASIYLREGNELVLQAQVGYTEVIERVPLSDGVISRAVREGRAILVEDVSTDPDFLATTPGVISEVAVPIVSDGRITGVLNVEAGRERRLGQWDLALIQIFSQQVNVAMASVARHQQTVVQAMIDPLTGLPNQAAFMHQLERAWTEARQQRQPLSLIFLDLDNFKLANDAFGHRFGDELLEWLGAFFPRALPSGAFVARYSGEEFVVILPRTPLASAEFLAEELRSDMENRKYETSIGHAVLLSVSAGVAAVEPDAEDIMSARELLHAADRAMYAAKRAGRNRVIRWSRDVAASLRVQV